MIGIWSVGDMLGKLRGVTREVLGTLHWPISEKVLPMPCATLRN